MAEVVALPANGTVIVDARGGSRAMRVTWHQEAGMVVLSLWRATLCVGTFRLPAGEVPALVEALVEGLAEQATADHPTTVIPS